MRTECRRGKTTVLPLRAAGFILAHRRLCVLVFAAGSGTASASKGPMQICFSPWVCARLSVNISAATAMCIVQSASHVRSNQSIGIISNQLDGRIQHEHTVTQPLPNQWIGNGVVVNMAVRCLHGASPMVGINRSVVGRFLQSRV
jgi:hypothetical protein